MRAALAILLCLILVGWIGSGVARESSPYGPLVAMKVKGVTLDPISSKPVAVLETTEGKTRLLPIWIGRFEANAIALQMEKIPTLRPLTHDLIKNILNGLNAKVERVVITKLEDNIFFAELILKLGGRTITVDSRPSDAIAVALRMKAPIYATEQVLTAAKTMEEPEQKEASLATSAWGMTVQTLTPELAEHFFLSEGQGVLVSHVQEGSLAASAGVRQGDVITSVGDRPVDSIEAFQEALKAAAGQSHVAVHLQRGKASHDLTIRLEPSSD
jgi:hypothetical protein